MPSVHIVVSYTVAAKLCKLFSHMSEMACHHQCKKHDNIITQVSPAGFIGLIFKGKVNKSSR